MMQAPTAFPITPLLPGLRTALDAHTRLVLEAPPGAGKTTQVPPALLDVPWLAGRRIVMLEPRRIAARAAARFMAEQRGEEVGRTIGYRIRFESKVSAATRVEVVTEGILTRLIQDDPELPGVGAILFDEFHERHLAADLGLALALDVQSTLRPDLRLLVMSATLDGERIARWLDAPRLSSPGRSFPVRIEHPPARAQETPEHQLARVARQALEESAGDVLVFLPGRREIARAQALLENALPSPGPNGQGLEILALHGELSLAEQQAAWGIGAGSDDTLRWLDPPPAGALAQARELLAALGALDADGRITPLGRRMLALGASPRLAAAALRAPAELRPLAADLLALVEARSPLRGEQARSDDFRARVDALHAWRDRRVSAAGPSRAAAARGGFDSGAMAAIEQAARGWRRRLDVRTAASGVPDSHAVGDLLLHAWPDRIARRDEANPRRYTLANGRGASLHEASALSGEPWLVVLDLRLDARDSLVLAAAPFDPRRLEGDFPRHFHRERALRWNEARGAVEAFEEQRFGAIVLERRSVPVQPADALPALLAAIRSRGLDVLPWSDAARRLRARMQALAGWMPELGLPDVSDAALLDSLEHWLGPYLQGKRKLDALGTDELSQALVALFDYEQRRQLDQHAPESLTVPSGQARKLEYAPGEPPVLAVKLQELFGLADTPRVAGGRVPVTLHLLSPAGRPIQVTQDLKGFWERTYPEVKKELRGRYPRHPWPDDPWSATPTHRAKPRGT